jgi:CSLREA domain-containing protein
MGIVVNTLADGTDSTSCSLRDAISAANADNAVGGCAAGQGADVITFSVAGTITLAANLPEITSNLTVDGGHVITVDGTGTYRPFSIQSGDVTLTGLTITNGHAMNGGGIDNHGNLAVSETTITASTAEISGGAINSDVALTVEASTICGNTSATEGGGIAFHGTASITNSTICDNTATRVGGGIVAWGLATITNVTIAANTANGVMIMNGLIGTPGGGINTYAPGTRIANSLLIGNVGSDTAGPMIIKSSLTQFSAPKETSVADIFVIGDDGKPLLADNGGPTRTIALAPGPGNPAVDAGDTAVCQTTPVSGADQRGFARPSACDIGAFEAQAAPIEDPNDQIPQMWVGPALAGVIGVVGLIGAVLVARRLRGRRR